jgi:hypothetical protein
MEHKLKINSIKIPVMEIIQLSIIKGKSMSFIGVISDNKCYERIKGKILELCDDPSVIHINKKSVENIKNVKFEIIIINENLEKLEEKSEYLQIIFSNAKYLLVNTDINSFFNYNCNDEITIITYGLNRKATVTVSSIGDLGILVYLQRNIFNSKNKLVEITEKRIKLKKENKCKTYEILILYIISILYDKCIINEI